MKFTLLGPLTATHNGKRMPCGSTKQQILLSYLLLHANRQVTVAELIEALWGLHPPVSAVKNIQLYVGRLRRTLRSTESEQRLHTVGKGYLLSAGPDEIDLEHCHRLIQRGMLAWRASERDDAARLFAEALGLWQGRPLSALMGTASMAAEIRCLEELRLMLHENYIEVLLEAGRHREVVSDLQRLVEAHPHHERLRFQLMLALARAGDRLTALAAYRDGYHLLAKDLGIEPCRALRELHDSILTDTVPPVPRQPEGRSRGAVPSPHHEADLPSFPEHRPAVGVRP
ncbi:BTAD domain-containing putative transcriptional regulator [Streptomyces sp. NPDC090442]|uniref:AfsR/SARP family transcriptional regulator n=1 Tax=Streptomyces sp. NPDC090442 TaxID=3365962 RepID=UPI00382B1C82